MRVELIGHFEPCMTEIYLHLDARMADYIRTHPYARPPRPLLMQDPVLLGRRPTWHSYGLTAYLPLRGIGDCIEED